MTNQTARDPKLDAAPTSPMHAIGNMLEKNIVAMVAAVIEARKNGAEAGMVWIENTLDGPDLLPDEDETDAQAYFDLNAPSIESCCYVAPKVAALASSPQSPASGEAPKRNDWQKRAVEVGFEYWRSSDAHGVECKAAQAVELLQELLGVEVEITNVAPPKCSTCDDNGMIGGPSFYAPDEGGVPCPDCSESAEAEAFEQLCREHGIAGTAAARQCEVFWRAGAAFHGAPTVGALTAWQISERMPNHHRQRTSLENINDVLEILAAAFTPGERDEDEQYTMDRGADLLTMYAEWVKNNATATTVEEHPYLPELEMIASDLRGYARVAPSFTGPVETVTIKLEDLIEGDDYGIPGSDFYRCRICHSESGAGMLNKGITHESNCPLAKLATPAPSEAVKGAEEAAMDEAVKDWTYHPGVEPYPSAAVAVQAEPVAHVCAYRGASSCGRWCGSPSCIPSPAAPIEAEDALPNIPGHPEPRTHTWSRLEKAAIRCYGEACFVAGRHAHLAAPVRAVEQQPADWAKIEAFIDDYVDDYEMRGEDEQGREGCHSPSADERALIRDCIAGLLADPDFVPMLAAPKAEPAGLTQGKGDGNG